MEYEKNRDMESRIKELESSLGALENDLEHVQNRESEAKLSAEKAISEIKRWNEEVEGMDGFYVVFVERIKISRCVTFIYW